ncbi:TetR family transcriptional regulator [Aquabacterium commune]|uniref:TetR family transcriptional regulator n=1 Tax=Aquabacterium commune TaxID=70586 RepID=A0A4R6R7C0_9BURK|nr:nucleoid occlusion factor SlmA [Aquabacterium commune]TDP81625.1 TetR family transcriptional regulator [Aquabacterium commune]
MTPDVPVDPVDAPADAAANAAAKRTRPKPGERRLQILQALAAMLEAPEADRITTAALAARLDVSEAALYRHFASKAQMFEGLIAFIEESLFTLANQVLEREPDPAAQLARIVSALLQFAEKNPGMGRVLAGDALVFEHARLNLRINQCIDRLESILRQPCRALAEARGSQSPTVDAQAAASAAISLVLGRWQRHARTGFARKPTEHLDATLRLLLG